MKLFPKARPVRIKLNVGGEEHSSLDSLRANFNVEEVLKLYESGGLQNWLRQINRLDIIDQLAVIDSIPLIQDRYVKCIRMFFDGLNRLNSIDDILNGMYGISKSNFYNLLKSFSALQSTFYLFTVAGAKKLWDKVIQVDDEISMTHISECIYNQLSKDLKKVQGFIKSSNKGYPGGFELIERFNKEWNFDIKTIDELISGIPNVIDNLLNEELLKYHRDKLMEWREVFKCPSGASVTRELFYEGGIDVIKKESVLSGSNLPVAHQIVILNTKDDLIKQLSDIKQNYYKTTRKNTFVDVLLLGCRQHIVINCYWYKPESRIGALLNGSDSSMLSAWSELYAMYYLISLAFAETQRNTRELLSFLKANTNRNGLLSFLEMAHLKLSPFIKRHDLTGLMAKSIIFLAILCTSRSMNGLRYATELCEVGYRPAILYKGIGTAKNQMEEQFMKLGDVERIPFMAEHILDF